MKKVRMRWVLGPLKHPLTYIAMCFNKREFASTLRDMKIPLKHQNDFMPEHKDACVHCFVKTNNAAISCVVCINALPPTILTNRVSALLAHEAVHIWQYICDHMNECDAGREVSAYCIQAITFDLLELYKDRHDGPIENTGSK